MQKPIISVIIGTYNQKEIIPLILDGFANQTLQPDQYELIIVDSESTDGTTELLKNHTPKHHYRHIVQKNEGKSGARNRGVKEAAASLIFITDGDMIPAPDLLETHINAHQKINKTAIFEGQTRNLAKLEWPTTEDNCTPYIKVNYKNFAKLGWYYFLTGNISFPKQLFIDENGFDPSFLGYGWEDIELGYRLSKKNIPIYYLKTAVNYHYHVITKDEEIDRNYNKGKSAKIFLKKHPNLKWYLGLNPLSVFIFNRIKKDGKFINWTKKICYPSQIKILHEFGFWFLKEHNYLSGILS